MEIVVDHRIPDAASFTSSEVAPTLSGTVLTIHTGTGPTYPWGAAFVTSTVVLSEEDLVAIHIRFYHRHGGNQFWYFYRHDQPWTRVQWNYLFTADRQRILRAYEQHAPAFASLPGDLPGKQRGLTQPHMNRGTTCVLAQVVGGRVASTCSTNITYTLGQSLAKQITWSPGAMFYSYDREEVLLIKFNTGTLLPKQCYERPMILVLLECEVSGDVRWQAGKIASSDLRPLRIMRQFEYTPTP